MARQSKCIRRALVLEPENVISHTNRGWAFLGEGNTQLAFEHFQEALRLNPNSEWAREGILKTFLYRQSLVESYRSFDASSKTMFVIILLTGLGFIYQRIETNHWLAPLILAGGFLAVVLAYPHWLYLFLRFNEKAQKYLTSTHSNLSLKIA